MWIDTKNFHVDKSSFREIRIIDNLIRCGGSNGARLWVDMVSWVNDQTRFITHTCTVHGCGKSSSSAMPFYHFHAWIYYTCTVSKIHFPSFCVLYCTHSISKKRISLKRNRQKTAEIRLEALGESGFDILLLELQGTGG